MVYRHMVPRNAGPTPAFLTEYNAELQAGDMGTVKDIIWIGITILGGVLTVAGVYWRIHYRLKDHDSRICDNTSRIETLEKGDTKTDHKLDILSRNLVRIMEKLEIEPIRDLFDK
jgi:hypothetical protein